MSGLDGRALQNLQTTLRAACIVRYPCRCIVGRYYATLVRAKIPDLVNIAVWRTDRSTGSFALRTPPSACQRIRPLNGLHFPPWWIMA